MSTLLDGELETALGALGRGWLWILGFGVISVLAGLAALFWPGATLLAIAIVFAVQLIVAGVFRFVAAFAIPGETGWLRALQAVLAVLSFVVGFYLLRHVALSLLVVALVLGFYWTVSGVIELFLAIGHRELPGRAWMIVSGILSVVAGVILVVMPGISLFVLTLVLGVWLIFFGAMLIARAFRVRAAVHGVRSGALRPSGT